MKGTLDAARIRNASLDFSSDSLLATAQRVDPRRYSRCMEKLRLHRCSSDQILDFVFGVDHVIDVGESVYAGIDLTVDPMRYASKVRKAQSLCKLRMHIGIEQFFVVLMVGDIYKINKEAIRRSTEDFWDALVDSFNGPVNRVHCFRFYIS